MSADVCTYIQYISWQFGMIMWIRMCTDVCLLRSCVRGWPPDLRSASRSFPRTLLEGLQLPLADRQLVAPDADVRPRICGLGVPTALRPPPELEDASAATLGQPSLTEPQDMCRAAASGDVGGDPLAASASASSRLPLPCSGLRPPGLASRPACVRKG